MNYKLLMALAGAALLAACGGGGRDTAPPPPPATQVPDSAMASSQAMVNFVKSMREDDSSEPLSMTPASAPMSETEEPVPGG